MDDRMVRAEVEALDGLLARVQELPEGEARTAALSAIQALLRLYGEALRRIVAAAAASPTSQLLSQDELISHLMLLHDLHPASVEDRVRRALEEVSPYMGSHGGGIELVEISDGVARVRLQGTCNGCAASSVTLRLAVEEAILRLAPELHTVEALETDPLESEAPPASELAGLALPMFDGHAPATSGRWVVVDAPAALAGDGPLQMRVEGAPLVFARAGGQLYAYRDRCPACRSPISEPQLREGTLRCSGCGRRYDIRRAGVGVDGGLMQLDPVPLLVEGGEVRVAIEAVPA